MESTLNSTKLNTQTLMCADRVDNSQHELQFGSFDHKKIIGQINSNCMQVFCVFMCV